MMNVYNAFVHYVYSNIYTVRTYNSDISVIDETQLG